MLERVTLDGTKIQTCVNKKTFRRADKICVHVRLARKHLCHLQQDEVEEEERGLKKAAQERVERLESALAEVERLP